MCVSMSEHVHAFAIMCANSRTRRAQEVHSKPLTQRGACAQRLGLAGWQREGGSPNLSPLSAPNTGPNTRLSQTPWPSSKPQRSKGHYLVKTVVQYPPMLLGRGRLAAGCDSRPSAHHSRGVDQPSVKVFADFCQTFLEKNLGDDTLSWCSTVSECSQPLNEATVSDWRGATVALHHHVLHLAVTESRVVGTFTMT
jgi:hypothetical protein